MSNTQLTDAVKAADIQFPAASPMCTLRQKVGLTDVEISYSRPGIKERRIFGGLVPFGKLWRAGANQATKISFSTPVKLGGTDIAAGAYILLAIPEKDEWTIIINKDVNLAGTGKYDEKLDVARVKAKSTELSHVVDNYTIEFDSLSDESASLNFIWEKTKVSVKFEVAYIKNLISQVETAMNSSDDNKPYFQAALLFLNHDHNLQKAAEWVDVAIKERPIYPFYLIKAAIQAKLGDKQAALATAKQASESAAQANDTGFVSRTEDFIAGLK